MSDEEPSGFIDDGDTGEYPIVFPVEEEEEPSDSGDD